jgi:sRNA-binding regulator protein Hfq
VPDSSAIPARAVYDARQAKAKTQTDEVDSPGLPSISPAGPRKLIRPRLPAGAQPYRPRLSALPPVITNHQRWQPAASEENNHAEAFYFQKQINTRTPMIFLLEDGERIEGTIEWYDRNAIKVRQGNVRTLIYKSSIKYLYKATEIEAINGRP